MIGDITGLIIAVTGLLVVILVGAVLYRPPAWVQKWKRFKFWQFEAETDTKGPVVIDPPVTQNLLPPEATGPSATEPDSTIPTPDPVGEAFDALLTQKKYDEGLQLLRKSYVGKDVQELVRMEAVYYWFAFKSGFEDAFPDLKKLVAAYSNNFSALAYYASALKQAGDLEQALLTSEKAYALAANNEDRLTAAKEIASVKRKMGTPVLEAARLLAAELPMASSPLERARVYRAIADLYKGSEKGNAEMRLLILEAALKHDPNNKELIFDVAHSYGTANAYELALSHYRKLISIDSEHTAALNNAGVAAEQLNNPIEAVRYYRRSEQKGEDTGLASANIASRLINAGFVDEALATLEAAKTKHAADDLHSNVLFNIGRIPSMRQSEETALKEGEERASRAIKWMRRIADAILHAQSDATGNFSGDGVTLELSSGGQVSGTLKPTLWAEASISGVVRGRLIEFDWKEPTSSTTLLPTGKSGVGRAILESDDSIAGYYVEGSHQIDSKQADKWTEFAAKRMKD